MGWKFQWMFFLSAIQWSHAKHTTICPHPPLSIYLSPDMVPCKFSFFSISKWAMKIFKKFWIKAANTVQLKILMKRKLPNLLQKLSITTGECAKWEGVFEGLPFKALFTKPETPIRTGMSTFAIYSKHFFKFPR